MDSQILIIAAAAIIAVIVVVLVALITGSSSKKLSYELKTLKDSIGGNDSRLGDEFTRNREENNKAARESREELTNSFNKLMGLQQHQFESFAMSQRLQLEDFSKRQDVTRQRIDEQLKEIREETAKKLEETRRTVDENLKDTVEKRFNESFKIISERLEKVHQGLGEMQQLASGVGDLKRVLTNVKTRGTLGEIQLGAILEQILSSWQYEAQFPIKNGRERVDYVVKLPDKNDEEKYLYLPIDSKFPIEDYQRLLEAQELSSDSEEIKRASAAFETSVRNCAKSIYEKYVDPPVTTDFAIMFVPTESLYAEITRRIGLFERLQQEYKITVAGPSNLAALLYSFQMGFRTLAIERRSNEVWQILGAVRTEFSKFGTAWEDVGRSLNSVLNRVNSVATRSRQLERRLRSVESLSEEESVILLGESDAFREDDA